ncbi:MAG: HisA/HisF-related TIM barrel protein [Dehalococcoidia bacterium]|nr:HisA/HisF-related TIM barrel protein [Dehalococcoidia bacterium]
MDLGDLSGCNTPLHWASEGGHLEVVKALLEAGADTDLADGDGATPLHYASHPSEGGHVEVVKALLEAGADKVAVNTSAMEDPSLVSRGAERFGSQCIVVAIDAKRNSEGGWEVYTYGGRRPTGKDALKWAEEVYGLGAGEILLTSMDADGHQTGYDLELTREVCRRVGIPVIASGGAGGPEHLYQAVVEGEADAVLAASIFHYGTHPVRQVKEYLAAKGVPVRL